MTLAPGSRLGAFEITEPIGVRGMREVYRARDVNLGRDVAIKVLPEALSKDADRLARFEREAKTLASLNHPNIAIIHGFEKSDGVRALVMELVEGPTLAARIAQGPMPFDEALFTITSASEVDRQIAVLDVRVPGAQPKIVIHGGDQARYLPSGHVVYAADNSLRAVRFDLDRLEAFGSPVPVLASLRTFGATGYVADFDVADDGTLVYLPSSGRPAQSAAARKSPFPRRRARISIRESPRTVLGWRSTFVTRRATSGSGISYVETRSG
jgi:protein kinase-like protein